MRLRVLAGVLLAGTLVSGYTLLATLSGREVFGRFGDAVCGLDFNNDGHSDVFVAEPGWNRVWCFFGSPGFDTTPDLLFRGSAGTRFGYCLAATGDINADGIADLAIGAPRDNSGGPGAGRVYVHFGSGTPDTVPDLIITGHSQGGRLGASVAGSFDVNADSWTDLVVGAPGEQYAYVFLGGPLLDTIPDLNLWDGNGDYYGGAVCLLGDVTDDSIGDILVGDYRHSGPILHGGGCFLYHGSDPPDPQLDQLWEGNEQNRQLGVTVCAPGDINGDSINDLAFGGSYTATVDLHWGGSTIDTGPDVRLRGNQRFGSWIHGGYDVNDDGFSDLLVGADGDEYGVPNGPGYAYLFLGGDPMSTSPDTVLVGDDTGDMFGSCLAFLGDINDDRSIEFIVGAPGHNSPGQNAGRAYIWSTPWTAVKDKDKVARTKAKPRVQTIISDRILRLPSMPSGASFTIFDA
ncbi:MAG: FG-GAP repeat protein, partial [candidate division WOR-3 bacterium]